MHTFFQYNMPRISKKKSMTGRNTMRKKLISYSACMLTGLMLAVGGLTAITPTQVSAAVTAASIKDATTTPGLHINGGGYALYYADQTPATGYVYLDNDIKTADGKYILKKGTYYFSNGILDKAAAAIGRFNVTSISASNYQKGAVNSYILKRNTLATPSVSNGITTVTSNVSYFTGQFSGDGKIYQNGSLLNGYALIDKKMYSVSNGVKGSGFTGVLSSSYVSVTDQKTLNANFYYYNNGNPYTGVVDRNYYVNGQFQSTYTGWKLVKGSRYYFKEGKAVKGWKYLRSFAGKKKYKYYFAADGKLVDDLFSLNYKKYIKVPMNIEINITTHTFTFFAYNSKTKKYDIPLKSVVCATSAKKGGTKTGHFRLEKTSAQRWFIYKKSNPYHYYQWAVHIKGTPSLIHSSVYYNTNNNRLNPSVYNRLGTSCTTYCVRLQAGNAKIVYDIATKTNKKKRVWVHIFRSSDKGAFGKITLKNTTGKLSSKATYDPTDPAFANKKK